MTNTGTMHSPNMIWGVGNYTLFHHIYLVCEGSHAYILGYPAFLVIEWPLEVIHKLGHSSRPSIISALNFCLSNPTSEFIPRLIGTLIRRKLMQ